MTHPLSLAALVLASALPGALAAQSAVTPATEAAAALPPGDRSGARLAQNTCLQCHGTGVAPDLRLQQIDYQTLHHVTRQGLNAMPSFRETEISDAELREVWEFLRSIRAMPGTPLGPVPGAIGEGH
ncbi:c-type cytochrome [Mangrovicoccus ximenensis]|uniref:c-type cytochrome n=1 Tax=Mangrovicoccus ximenensis TaxID=1911570 RepID=UPI000D36AD28|nr:cytochrome c [Mangrovicoccus ximenensis]